MNKWTLFISALLLSASASAETIVKTMTGYATDAKTGELLYLEEHERTVEDGETTSQIIRYRAPEGDVFAQKVLDFRDNPRRPLFTLEDTLRNYREGLRETDGGLEVFSAKAGDLKSEMLKQNQFVADAGFDRIIENDWSTLVTGKPVKFDFLVPAQTRTVKFRVKKTDEREHEGREAVEFTMEPASGLLRWLVDPIVVLYDVEERTLLKYDGMSNLRNEKMKNYDVDISFPHAERKVIDGGLTAE
ncbi:MAG: hypothetical protein AAF552_00205 [Pseudomonadota bacterium]